MFLCQTLCFFFGQMSWEFFICFFLFDYYYSECHWGLKFCDILLKGVVYSCRRRVIQVYANGARILDGAFMTQELSFKAQSSDSASESQTVLSVSIADPYVLLRMIDGSIQLLVGGIFQNSFHVCIISLKHLNLCDYCIEIEWFIYINISYFHSGEVYRGLCGIYFQYKRIISHQNIYIWKSVFQEKKIVFSYFLISSIHILQKLIR